MNFFVEIVEDATDEVVKRMGPMGERKADRVERGAGINLDWGRFHTRIVEEEDA